MHWFDWLVLAVVVVVAIVQTVRGTKAGGMGLPMFEAAGLVVAAVAAGKFAGPLAEATHLSKAMVLTVTFVLLAALAFVAGRWLFGLTGWSFQSMDGFFSFVFGVVAGWTFGYMILRIIIESQGYNGEVATLMVNSPVAREIFSFRTWNALLRLLFKAKLGPDFNPDVG
jgi:uncharacterized membrane protein required for colicin V production